MALNIQHYYHIWLRHPKTTSELREWESSIAELNDYAESKLPRLSRSRSNLPDDRDEVPRVGIWKKNKSWKLCRKTKWK